MKKDIDRKFAELIMEFNDDIDHLCLIENIAEHLEGLCQQIFLEYH
jgi:hypothetical protein